MISKLLKKNEKGFTLMEMLIVVAIIAVLIAIAIPTFNSSLNKARVATDEANIRSGYATAMAEMLAGDIEPADDAVYYLMPDGSVSPANAGAAPTGAYTCKGNNNDTATAIAGKTVGDWAKDDTVTYTYDAAKTTFDIAVG